VLKNMTKPKEEKVVETATEEVEQESTELTPYEAMDLVDEGQMIDELEGKLSPQDMETFVYSFPDKATGKDITGLSWKGTKATWWELNNKKLTDMTVTDKVLITQGDNYVDVAVYAYDSLRKIGAWGMARGYTNMQTRNGAVEDKFASAKAMSKAQRNALNQLFPSELVAKMINEWVKKGHSKQLTPQVINQTRSQVARYGGATRSQYPTQQELMQKFGMDPSQVAPKCPNCGATMSLVQRKDGSGIFWSCANWRTKGCKGYNVDEVDIDGTITMKQPKQQAKSKQNQQSVDDIPF
jgi:hypothetical protein